MPPGCLGDILGFALDSFAEGAAVDAGTSLWKDKLGEKVANDCGISVSALAMYESGKRMPRDEIKVKLARYYNTTVEALFFTS